jgi:hypothetical protein
MIIAESTLISPYDIFNFFMSFSIFFCHCGSGPVLGIGDQMTQDRKEPILLEGGGRQQAIKQISKHNRPRQHEVSVLQKSL